MVDGPLLQHHHHHKRVPKTERVNIGASIVTICRMMSSVQAEHYTLVQ